MNTNIKEEKLKHDVKCLVQTDIKLLKDHRTILWDMQEYTACNIDLFADLVNIKNSIDQFKEYVDSNQYNQFLKEYHMFIYLLDKCLIKSVNEDNLPKTENSQKQLEETTRKIKDVQVEMEDSKDIIDSLKTEDSTAHKVLTQLGLTENQIQLAIQKGFKVDSSILDIEPKIDTKK